MMKFEDLMYCIQNLLRAESEMSHYAFVKFLTDSLRAGLEFFRLGYASILGTIDYEHWPVIVDKWALNQRGDDDDLDSSLSYALRQALSVLNESIIGLTVVENQVRWDEMSESAVSRDESHPFTSTVVLLEKERLALFFEAGAHFIHLRSMRRYIHKFTRLRISAHDDVILVQKSGGLAFPKAEELSADQRR